jgi:FkbM family methyltransferase
MTNYWDTRFLRHIDRRVECVVEVGARYGSESVTLATIFDKARVYSFECNPLTVDICRERLAPYENIKFFDYALGEVERKIPFYSFVASNDGASSIFQRIDFGSTQRYTGDVKVRRLSDIMREEEESSVDLLCMDVQGYELNVLKGCGKYIKNIKFVIMEEPNREIDTEHLPPDTYSKYIGAPTPSEIARFMTSNNFEEIERVPENKIEDNVMYINKSI